MLTWRDRIGVHVEWGPRTFHTPNAGTWDGALWDTGVWSGDEPDWTRLSDCEIVSFNSTRRRDRAVGVQSTGSGRLILEWPVPLAGIWSFKPSVPVRLGDELRLVAYPAGYGPVPVFRGTVTAITDTWSPLGPYRLTVDLVDRLAQLAAVDLPAQTSQGAGDTVDARIERIATEALVSPLYLDLEPSLVALQATELAQNLLGETNVAVASEGSGSFMCDRSSVLTFRAREWWLRHPRGQSPRLTWTNRPAGLPPSMTEPVICPGGFETSWSARDVYNVVAMAAKGGTQVTVTDPTSVTVHGRRTYQRNDLLNADPADVTYAAQWWLDQHADRSRRFDSLTWELDPLSGGDVIAAGVDVDIDDMQRVVWYDGSPGAPLAVLAHVVGVGHHITADSWRVTVDLFDVVGSTVILHGWDVEAWDTAQWV